MSSHQHLLTVVLIFVLFLQGASRVNMKPEEPDQSQWNRPRQVVYAPACVTRMMGPSASDDQRESVHEKLLSLFKKANYQVIYPEVRTPAWLHPAVSPAMAASCVSDVHAVSGMLRAVQFCQMQVHCAQSKYFAHLCGAL